MWERERKWDYFKTREHDKNDELEEEKSVIGKVLTLFLVHAYQFYMISITTEDILRLKCL